MLLAVAYRPSQIRKIGFRPPAIQFRKIDASIDQHFHAAGSASLPWPPRRVDPNIHSLHQTLGQEHVVIAKENNMGAHLRPLDEIDPFMDQGLSRLVFRMRLASDDDLNRAIWIG